ncbi:hypothetical protein FHU38_003636 [Saccharomonospora amisosensis]|uniref:Golgi phosphoprotein 3 (GPP34) n=1 Tax=Saccharomonospora amisosensis TaxID=1128677 RepID=A0A7X5USB4_9PSEU|nr:GPP34 family phosphoprotein [Saccharomonospora amisosensis]NIJ13292.1 hypothetical protein [Saccharomonospora amisosensis]
MLIAEDLLLLLFDDKAGKPVDGVSNLDYSMAGAVLIELAMLGRIDVTTDADDGKSGRLVIRDSTPTGEATLDESLATLSKLEGKKPKDVIGPLTKGGLSQRLLDGLVQRGILRREQGRVLGLFPTTRWPAQDSRHEQRTRAELNRVLVDGQQPNERTTALVALLAGMGVTKQVVGGRDPRLVERRATEIAEGNWAGDALRRAVEEITSAVMAALFVPTIVTGAT